MKNVVFSYVFLPKNNKFKQLVEFILLRLFRYLTSRDDVQVWQKKDRYGRSYWQAYDSATDKKISLASEAEMRIWIEQRYYK